MHTLNNKFVLIVFIYANFKMRNYDDVMNND